MNPYLKIIKTSELDAKDLCDKMAANIVEEMDRIFPVKAILVNNDLTPFRFIGLIFMDPLFRDLRPILLSLLNRYSANYYSLLWSLSKVLVCSNPVMANTIVNELKMSLIWPNIANSNNLFTISTIRGNFQFLSLDNYLPSYYRPLINNIDYFGRCHDAVWVLAPYFKEYEAKTVKMPNLLGGGSFFHSFFEKDGIVLDFSSKMAGVSDSLTRVIEPEFVYSSPAGEIHDRYEKLCNEDAQVPHNICPVLTLAVSNERKLH